MISYGGIVLRAHLPHVAEWVERAYSERDCYDMAEPFWPTSRAGVGWTRLPQRPVRPGSLYWPTGASRWAVGHFLCSSTELASIRIKAYHPAGSGYQSLPLVLDDGNLGGKITTQLFLLPARPLYQIAGAEQLYLLALVDERFFFWQQSAAITVTAGTTTWAQLYSSIASALGVTLSVDTLEAAYLQPGADLAAQYEFLPPLLDAVCASTGRRLVRSLDGTLTAQSPVHAKLAQDAQQADRARLSGGLYDLSRSVGTSRHDLNGLVPSAVTVSFRRTDSGVAATSRYAVTTTLVSLGLTEYAGVTARAGEHLLRSSAVATFAGGGSPTNDADLVALAAQLATDWYRWQLGRLDCRFAGICAYEPEGLSDSVLWTDTGEEVTTRVWRGPLNDTGGMALEHHTATWPGTVATDEKSKVSSNDTTAGYLNGKIVAGANVTLTENNDGGNETLTIAAALTGGTIVVREVDGSPTGSVDTVEFDKADGLQVTIVGTTATIDALPASTTQTGVVNTTTQSFAGNKTFVIDSYALGGYMRVLYDADEFIRFEQSRLWMSGAGGGVVMETLGGENRIIGTDTLNNNWIVGRLLPSNEQVYGIRVYNVDLGPPDDIALVFEPHNTAAILTSLTDEDVRFAVEDAVGSRHYGAYATTSGLVFKGGLYVSGSISGLISDGDKGDITVSSSGATWTIDNDVVTFAKAQDVAAWTFVIRNAGSSGDMSAAAIGDFTTATPAGTDYVVGFLSSNEIRKYAIADIVALVTAYTDEEAQDAVGGILDDGTVGDIVFTYDDTTPLISGVVENDAITNAKLDDMAAYSFKVNLTGSSASPTDAIYTDFTTEVPDSGDFVLGFLADGSLAKYDIDDLVTPTDLTDAVILAPNNIPRNLIQPTGDYAALQLKGHASQSVALFRLIEASGSNNLLEVYVGASGSTTLQLLLMNDTQFIFNTTTYGCQWGAAANQRQAWWGATPTAQPASANQDALTLDSDVTGSDTVDLAAVNSNFAALETLVNQLRADLVTLGLIKGSA